jgi:hypothetical protein
MAEGVRDALHDVLRALRTGAARELWVARAARSPSGRRSPGGLRDGPVLDRTSDGPVRVARSGRSDAAASRLPGRRLANAGQSTVTRSGFFWSIATGTRAPTTASDWT